VTKLNHNRPSLRYLDNLRREIRRENRPAPSWFNPARVEQFGIQLAEPESFPDYVSDFGRLPIKQQEIAGCAIEAFGAHLDAISGVISLIMKGKAKARKAAKELEEQAHEDFIVAGAVLVGTIIDDMAAKRDGFWQWFRRFHAGLDRQSKLTWSSFAEALLEDCLQLWFAQQLADTPQGVERWRKYLSADNWE
jgi:hypothetical protein